MRIFRISMAIIVFVVALTACSESTPSQPAALKATNEPSVNPVSTNLDEQSGNKMEQGAVVIDEYNGRKIYMYLPPGYETSEDRYPVVYMHDGQNVFDAKTSGYGKEWKVDETLDRLIAKGTMKPVIVAAVSHGGPKRAMEYVPFEDPLVPSDGKSAEAFSAYFTDEIIPYIDSTYRTLPDRDNRMIMGSSFGGLQALWMGYHRPDMFSAIGVVSPATQVAGSRLFKEFESMSEKPDVRIWLDMGRYEGIPIDSLVDTLIGQGFEYGKDLFYYMDYEGHHDEDSWSKRVHSPLLMFGGKESGAAVNMDVFDMETVFGTDGSYPRIHPIVTMENGMTFSAWNTAQYEVINEEAAVVDATGRVSFLSSMPLEIDVRYGDLSVKHSVDSARYFENVLRTLNTAVVEEQGDTLKLFLDESAEKLGIERELMLQMLRGMEPAGYYTITEETPEYVVLRINR